MQSFATRFTLYEPAHVSLKSPRPFQQAYVLGEVVVDRFFPLLSKHQTRLLPKQTKDHHRREERESRHYADRPNLTLP
jgi:hypothetical protein